MVKTEDLNCLKLLPISNMHTGMAKIQFLVMIMLLLVHITPLLRVEKLVTAEFIGLRLGLISWDSSFMNYNRRVETYWNISEARASDLRFSANWNKKSTMMSYHYFMVQLGIGDPNQYIYLNLDTAISPFTWTQRQPHWKSYDPRKSHTYRKIPHDSPICKYPIFKSHTYRKIPHDSPICKYPIFKRHNRDCIYSISYPNGGSAIGIASYEKFQFLTLKNTTTNINKITFGCTIESSEILNFGPSCGILAMNKSPESLITQLSSIVGGRFSYCLYSNPFFRGYLRFGNDIILGKGSKVQTSPLAHHLYYPYAYALNLIDISLGNLRLKIQEHAFARNTGFLIDTNTILSNIHRAAYIRIRKVLAYRFDKFRLKKISVSKLDLCYEMRSGLKLEHVIVPLTFHFQGGANLKVAPEKVFLLNKEKNCFCLGLLATDGPTVLGAMQQYDTRFIYDINKGTVSFAPEDCIASEKSKSS